MKKCKTKSNVKSITIINYNDLKFDGNCNIIGLKRKYGKFKREVIRFDP